MASELELKQALAYAAVAFREELTDEICAVYFNELGKTSFALLTEAVRACVRNGERFPTVAAIRDQINKIVQRSGGSDKTVRRNLEIARRVHDARKSGKSPDEVDALIETLERSLSVRE